MSVAVHCDVQGCGKFTTDPNSAGFIEVKLPNQTFHFCGLEHAAGAFNALASASAAPPESVPDSGDDAPAAEPEV